MYLDQSSLWIIQSKGSDWYLDYCSQFVTSISWISFTGRNVHQLEHSNSQEYIWMSARWQGVVLSSGMWFHVIWYKFSSVQEVIVATIWSIGDGNSRFFWNTCKFVSHFHYHFGATAWFPPWPPLWNVSMPFCLLPWFSVVNSTFSTHRLAGLSLVTVSSVHLLGFSDKSCFTGWRSEPHAQPQTSGSDLCIYVPRDSVVQLYPRILGVHFSHFLQQAWTMLELFLFPAITWGMYYTIKCHASTVTIVRTSSFQRGHLTYFYTGVISYWTMREKI